MPTVTIVFGAVLIVLGAGGYFGSGQASATALIPAGFGLLLVVFGAMARDEKKLKMAMHVAVVVGLVGFLGSARGLAGLAKMASGETVERPMAAIAQSVMAALMLIYVGLCVKSFIDARRQRARS
ncbi:MAG: hypothetical protein ACRD96_17015 [Bryobacteraceae bacterium]